MTERRNLNRGYRKLRVWQDAKELYVLSWRVFKTWDGAGRRLAANQMASVDSIHRNIAEGYCRRTINEYLQFLGYALGSLGESVSAVQSYAEAGQLVPAVFDAMDALAYRIENGLMRLVESLKKMRNEGGWSDSYVVRESNAAYGIPEAHSPRVRPQKTVHYPTATRRRRASIRSSTTSSSSVQRKEAL